jgi:cytochrome c
MKKNYMFALLCLLALGACNKAEEAHKVVTEPVVSSEEKMSLLARENNCTACHALDKKLIGPSWIDVARKYKGDTSAEERLIVKVSKGGAGVWGKMPMPAGDAVGKKQDQMKQLVVSILALAK